MSRTDPNAFPMRSATHSRSSGGYGADVHRAPIMPVTGRRTNCVLLHRPRCPERGDLGIGAAEHVVEHPFGVLAQGRPGLVVAGGAVGEAEAVALVESGAEERVRVPLEMVPEREPR